MPKVKVLKSQPKNLKQTQAKIGDVMKNILQTDRNSEEYGNSPILLDKYLQYVACVKEFLRKLFELVVAVHDEDLNARLKYYTTSLKREFKRLCCLDTAEFEREIDVTVMDRVKLRALRNHYLDLKESFLVLTPIIVTKNILAYKIDRKSVNDKSRYDEFCRAAFRGEIEFRIFKHIELGEKKLTIDYDFSVLFNGGSISAQYTEAQRKVIFDIIIELCEIGKRTSNIGMTPDIDISEILPQIIGLLEMFEGRVHGCGRAFEVIKKSSGIFEKNCNKYIRKTTRSGNPMHLFTEFVEDIIKEYSTSVDGEGAGNPNIVMELKRVIKEVRTTIEKAIRSKSETMPEHLKFIIDATDLYIDELELNTNGDMPSMDKIAELQQKFTNIFVP